MNPFRKLIATARGRWYRLLRPDLDAVLSSADPSASLGTRVAWIEELLAWIRVPVAPSKTRTKSQRIQAVRVRFLLQVLDRHPVWKTNVSNIFTTTLLETDALGLFCETGLSHESAFLSESLHRLMKSLLPTPRDDRDLAELFGRVFTDIADADWLEGLDSETAARLIEIIAPNPEIADALHARYNRSIAEALIVIAAQITSLGLSPEIRIRSREQQVAKSPFVLLSQLILRLQDIFVGGRVRIEEANALFKELRSRIQACESETAVVLEHLETHGVSIAIVFRIEALERLLKRCELLARLLLVPQGSNSAARLWLHLVADLARAHFEGSHLGDLFRDNMHLLARKIVERTGASGEHYIVCSRREYVAMLASAAGGGFLSAGTAIVKFFITHAKLPLFFEGFFNWLNYSGSFLLMQGFHFTLATKQPSMTAPALAAKLRDLKSREQIQPFVNEIGWITRSQFAAALGNVGTVIPTAILFDLLHVLMFGDHTLSADYALKTIESLHPLKSLTIPFAALTGVVLWFSSVCAGWTENWFVYRRLPEAIAQSPSIRFLCGRRNGRERAEKIAAFMTRNISAFAGNIALGFFLAFVPVFGKFFGLPLSVAHVTLSAGSLTFAACGAPDSIDWTVILPSAIGVAMIGVLNFGVSFALALAIAIRARNIKRVWLWRLLSGILQELRRRPLEFFFPARR